MKTYSIASPHILNLKLLVEQTTNEIFDENEFQDYLNLTDPEFHSMENDLDPKLYEAIENARIQVLEFDIDKSMPSIPQHLIHALSAYKNESINKSGKKEWPHTTQSKGKDGESYPTICFENSKHYVLNIMEALCFKNELTNNYGIYCRKIIDNTPLGIEISMETYITKIHGEAILYGYKICKSELEAHIVAICNEYPMHPIKDWIESVKWDGVDRLPALLETLECENPDIRNMVVPKWLVGAIAAIYEPKGVSSQGVLVLQGAQGLGKSRWIEHLCPEPVDNATNKLGLNLINKDSIIEFNSFWIVELGEIDATFKKSDISALKAFIDKKSDIYRIPFDKKAIVHPRRTVAAGTVNNYDYLMDQTGNRRYWTLACTHIDSIEKFEMQQLWAQIHIMYTKGERHWLNEDEQQLLADSNAEHTISEPIEIEIQNRFISDINISIYYNFVVERMTAGDIYKRLYGSDKLPPKFDVMRIGTYLREKLKPRIQKKTKSYYLIDLNSGDNDGPTRKWLKDQEKDDSSAKNALFDY